MRLENSHAVVTAAATGIGRATAIALHEAGAKVHVSDIDEAGLKQLAEEYPGIVYSVCDMSNAQAVDRMFDEIEQEFDGKLDFLVNNAGIAGPAGPLESLDIQGWLDTFDVNLHSTFYACKRAIPLLKRNGSGAIMNLSSTAGLHGYPMRTPYASAKWAIVGLTKSLAMELGEDNIRVNCICPGSVTGDRMDRVIASIAAASGESEEKVREDNVKATSMKTFVDPEDVASMILFTFSGLGGRISGQALAVDGHTHSLASD